MLIFLNFIFYLLLFIFRLIVFIYNRKHLLTILISLEFIVLTLYGLLFLSLNLINYEHFYTIVFLTFGVCEGALGLSILVSLIRIHGNDYFQTFNIFQC